MVLLVIAAECVVLDVTVVTIGHTDNFVRSRTEMREDDGAVRADMRCVPHAITGENVRPARQVITRRGIMHIQHERAAAAAIRIWIVSIATAGARRRLTAGRENRNYEPGR